MCGPLANTFGARFIEAAPSLTAAIILLGLTGILFILGKGKKKVKLFKWISLSITILIAIFSWIQFNTYFRC